MTGGTDLGKVLDKSFQKAIQWTINKETIWTSNFRENPQVVT